MFWVTRSSCAAGTFALTLICNQTPTVFSCFLPFLPRCFLPELSALSAGREKYIGKVRDRYKDEEY